jgi:hypothetical protein
MAWAGRRCYVSINGVLYEKGVDVIPGSQEASLQRSDSALWGDRHYDGMRAQDGSDISTRSKHREYMKRHGLTTCDDYKNEWKRAADVRADVSTTGGDHRARREDVARAVYEVTERNRKKGRR